MIGITDKYMSDSDESMAPDFAPLLDVLFMLLVFFLLTANSAQKVMELVLPEKGVEQAQTLVADDPLVLHLFAGQPRWKLGEYEFTNWQTTATAIIEAHADNKIVELVIAGDRNVSLERLLQVLGLLKQEGISVAQILMQEQTVKNQHIQAAPTIGTVLEEHKQ